MKKATCNQTGADERARLATLSPSTAHQRPSHISHTADVGPDGSAATFDPGWKRGLEGSCVGPRAHKSMEHLFLDPDWKAGGGCGAWNRDICFY